MPSPTQAHRLLALNTPLGKDVLLVRSASFADQLGRLFQLELDLQSEEGSIKFDDIVGQQVTLELGMPSGGTRYFNGFVSRFVQTSRTGRLAQYHATVVPWLWFLTRTSDCRIFQKLSAPEIIKKIFADHPFAKFRMSLSRNCQPWEYCVQYRETDFNFISRLMEQEGIYYFFEHNDGEHTMVLADAMTAHQPFTGCESLKYRPSREALREHEHIFEWLVGQEIQPGAYAHTDYNFIKPQASLLARAKIPHKHAHSELEIYDYPGEYDEYSEGDSYARVRIQELQTPHRTTRGQSNASGICTGSLLKLEDYPLGDENKTFLITSVSYQITSGEYFSSRNGEEGDFISCNFTAIDNALVFRPARTTPKPLVQGPQTAVVVGPADQEIYVDEYARVKVQFHWDRYGKKDEESSCWIRVAQPWAGNGYGALNVPRIGCEVIVEFLEGDPDQPIINGRVYNADTMPHGSTAGQPELERVQEKRQEAAKQTKQVIAPARPAKGGPSSGAPASGAATVLTAVISAIAGAVGASLLAKLGKSFVKTSANPAQGVVNAAMMTSLKSNSLGGSGGSNEISLNDTPGCESVFIKAERDMVVSVNNDYTTTVDKDMVLDVAGDRHTMIAGKDTLNIDGESETTVGKRYSLTVKKQAVIKITKMEQRSIGGNYQLTVSKDAITTIQKDATTNIAGKESHEVAKDCSFRVGENQTIEVVKNRTTTIKGDDKLTVEKTETVEVAEAIKVTGKKTIEVEAADEIVLKCGSTSVTMKKGGDIEIKGTNIKIEATAKIVSSATATNEIKGAMVKINS